MFWGRILSGKAWHRVLIRYGTESLGQKSGKDKPMLSPVGYRISCFCQHSTPWGVVPHPGTCQLQGPCCHSRLAVQPWSVKMCPAKTLSSAPKGCAGMPRGCSMCWVITPWLVWAVHSMHEPLWWHTWMKQQPKPGIPIQHHIWRTGWNGLTDLQDLLLFCLLTCTQQPPARSRCGQDANGTC